MGVRVMGANCGNGPDEIERVIGEMVAVKPADVYLIAQSNAGLPKYERDKQIYYDGTPEVMAGLRAEDEVTGHQLHRRVLRQHADAHRSDGQGAVRRIDEPTLIHRPTRLTCGSIPGRARSDRLRG